MRTTTNVKALGGILIAGLALALWALPVQAHDERAQAAAAVSNLNATALTATGTVAELIVLNQLTGQTYRYLGLRLDDGRMFALSGVGLDALVTGSRVDATGTLSGKTLNVAWFTPAAAVQAHPADAKALKKVDGTLAIYHMDFFEQGRGDYGLAVREISGNVTNLNVPGIPDTLQPNMQVSVDGAQAADGKSVDVSTITIIAGAPAQTGVAGAPVTNSVLVIPLSYSNAPAGTTGAAINTEFQNNVKAYYNEVSYGQQLLNITVACTTTVLPGCAGRTDGNGYLYSATGIPSGCDYTTMSNTAISLAQSAGYDTSITSTKFVYVMLPSGSGCGWAGLAYVGYGLAYSANYNALWVYGHEIGHNFGLWHAGSVGCGTQALGGSCGVNEYGDPFDIMGNIRTMHFNAMQKSRLNWIPSTSVKTHTSGTQTYQLSPIETGSQSTYAVKIPTSNANRTYWIEYRQPVPGFDAGLPSSNLGAQIRVSNPFESSSGSDDTEFVDMTPGDSSFDNGTLLATAPSYVDSSTGLTITVNSATPGASGLLTVTVAMGGGGGKTNTTTTLGSSANPAIYPTSVTFTATVAGTAPTGTVAFTDGGGSISGCTAIALASGASNSKAVTCTPGTLGVGSHAIVATYSGDASNNASTSATLSQAIVNKFTSSAALSSTANPVSVGVNVTFTATIAGTAPTGTVAFTDGGGAMSGCAAVSLAAGASNSKTVTCGSSTLGIGTHNIVATYSGDGSNTGSASTTLPEVIVNSTLALGIPVGKTDFNGDGKTDILWEDASGGGLVSMMNGASVLITQALSPAPGWVMAGVGDFNGDGHADLLWRNTADPTQYWINLMSGTAIISGGSITVAAGYTPSQIGDFNGDGKADILWENASGGRWIYFMNGSSILSWQAAPPAAPGWVIAGVGDFNGDGKTDILWKNTANPQQYWTYLMNGGSVIGGAQLLAAPGYVPTQIADFDGDGKADILWENGTAARWIYFMNGASISSGQPAPAGSPGWKIVGTGDFNGDHRADLLWQNSADSTQFWTYLLNGTAVIGGGGILAAPGYVMLVH